MSGDGAGRLAGSQDGPRRLTASIEAFCRIVEQLPAHAFLVKPWGPRQVLAHLVFWHEIYVRQIEAGQAGIGWLFPEGTLKAVERRGGRLACHRRRPDHAGAIPRRKHQAVSPGRRPKDGRRPSAAQTRHKELAPVGVHPPGRIARPPPRRRDPADLPLTPGTVAWGRHPPVEPSFSTCRNEIASSGSALPHSASLRGPWLAMTAQMSLRGP